MSPPLQQDGGPRPLTPLHPVARPHRGAGTTPELLRLIFILYLHPKETNSSSSSSLLHLQLPLAGAKGGERGPSPGGYHLGGGAIAILAEGLQREVLRSVLGLGHEFLSPSPAAICHAQLVS